MIVTRLYIREGGETGKGKRLFWQSINTRLGVRVLHCLVLVAALCWGAAVEQLRSKPLQGPGTMLRAGTKACSANGDGIVAGGKGKS